MKQEKGLVAKEIIKKAAMVTSIVMFIGLSGCSKQFAQI